MKIESELSRGGKTMRKLNIVTRKHQHRVKRRKDGYESREVSLQEVLLLQARLERGSVGLNKYEH
jgi:hypothetical protein